MSGIMMLGLLEDEIFKIMWAIGLTILIIICFTAATSKRIKDDEEDFRRNFKIGIARTLGALTTIYFVILITETIVYFLINK